ncbi:hypothetical protein NC652_021756 [Populus alba x Populus x berolinensis]|nr:hypothetical protein NC652_021756 [Populus alba x Populus x berolinensis]
MNYACVTVCMCRYPSYLYILSISDLIKSLFLRTKGFVYDALSCVHSYRHLCDTISYTAAAFWNFFLIDRILIGKEK